MTTTRASIRHVAELAKVSPMTVTRVMRGHGFVAEDTRQRVLAAVRQTNYVPVHSAVQNRHSSTSILGLVPSQAEVAHNRLDSETYIGIVRAARRWGYDLLVMLRGESEWMADRAAVRFLDRRSDGVLFITAGRAEWQGVLETLVQQQVPTVVCYRRDVPEGVVWIDPDNDAIIEQAVGALTRAGHRRIAYLTGPVFNTHNDTFLARQQNEGNFDDTMRRTAFDRVRREAGIEGLILENPRLDWTLDPAILDTIVAQGISGVVCVNDFQALQLWAMAEKWELHIPRDLSITGVDDIATAQERGLTSVSFGYDTVGSLAVEAWVEHVAGKPANECHRVVPVLLRERQSVAPPNQSVISKG